MKKRTFRIGMAVIALGFVAGLAQFGLPGSSLTGTQTPSDSPSDQAWKDEVENHTPETATFAGGCFWCIEGAYMGVEGVKSAVSGYTGGKASTATYDQVTTGETDHREAVRVKYYPSIISYKEILDIFWTSIDPTDDGGQFADRGYHYTTAIYAHTKKQYELANESKQNISESERFDEPIVTEIKYNKTFYKAEDYHQNYSKKNTVQYKAYERASGRTGFIDRVWE